MDPQPGGCFSFTGAAITASALVALGAAPVVLLGLLALAG